MYVDVSHSKVNGKTYMRCLLRENYREDGIVKHRTIANISHCAPEEISAIRLALTHKGSLGDWIARAQAQSTPCANDAEVGQANQPSYAAVTLRQGRPIGAVWLLTQLARELGITGALGQTRAGRLALWQVLARVIDQGSRLSATRLAAQQACGFLQLPRFNEDDLYANLNWLNAEQAAIEQALFKAGPARQESLYLYDVTSSYMEGEHNELAAFGYNRDGKKGKRQVVIGLLCDSLGVPLSIEVFAGNTQDPKTVDSQIRKVAQRFGADTVTFVGDRCMIKSPQIKVLLEQGHSYISAITKPQIDKLLDGGVLQMALFDNELAEVIDSESGERYVLRRNPVRQSELAVSRASKLASLKALVDKENGYLEKHTRARVILALSRVQKRIKSLGFQVWCSVQQAGPDQRVLSLDEDVQALAEHTRLDGCYVLKTNLQAAKASKETVHDRYKDLAQVEWAFRSAKTVLEMRPVFVRLASHTRAHALVVMLAYRLIQELARRWQGLDMTVQEGISHLNTLCEHEIAVQGQEVTRCIPAPNETVAQLFAQARIHLPVVSDTPPRVSTKKKLPSRRK